MKTYMPKVEEIQRQWYVVDATDIPLGRLASQVANVIRGKHKPIFTPHMDVGDFVIVVNAEKVALTGDKWNQKIHYRHSNYPGGLRATVYKDMRTKHPERIIELAIRRMLPKNRLGRQLFKKLKVYKGENHPHEAQKPAEMTIDLPRREV